VEEESGLIAHISVCSHNQEIEGNLVILQASSVEEELASELSYMINQQNNCQFRRG